MGWFHVRESHRLVKYTVRGMLNDNQLSLGSCGSRLDRGLVGNEGGNCWASLNYGNEMTLMVAFSTSFQQPMYDSMVFFYGGLESRKFPTLSDDSRATNSACLFIR